MISDKQCSRGGEEVKCAELNWQQLEQMLPRDYEALALKMGAVSDPRRWARAKFTSAALLLRVLFDYVIRGSLRLSALRAACVLPFVVSHVAIRQAMSRALPYLQTLLCHLMQSNFRTRLPFCNAASVVLIDSTVVTRPGSTGTDVRVHVMFRLEDLACVEVIVDDKHLGESLLLCPVEAGQICMGDRNFCHAHQLAHIIEQGGHVLVRYHSNLRVFQDASCRQAFVFDRKRLAGLRRPLRAKAWLCWIESKQGPRHAVRLMAMRLPAAAARRAQDSLRRRKKENGSRPPSAEELFLAQFWFLVSSVPRDELSLAQHFELYRLRWQIELEFKRAKSLCGLKELPCRVREMMLAWVTTHMLLQHLMMRWLRHLCLLEEPQPEPWFEEAIDVYDEPQAQACLASVNHPILRHRWYLLSLAWTAVAHACMPLTLATLARHFDRLLMQLQRVTGRRKRLRALEHFVRTCFPELEEEHTQQIRARARFVDVFT